MENKSVFGIFRHNPIFIFILHIFVLLRKDNRNDLIKMSYHMDLVQFILVTTEKGHFFNQKLKNSGQF